MEEIIHKFNQWTKLKITLHISERVTLFQEGEIWWVNLGANIGYEEEGKNENFERPVLVLRKFNRHLLWAVPLTTKIKPNNPFYYQYLFRNTKFSAILSQLRSISNKRLIRKIGRMPNDDYKKICEEIKKFI